MRELGYLPGRHYVIEGRYADGDYAKLPQLAGELVRRKVEIIITGGTPSTQAAQKATSTVPIIAALVGDPLGLGFAKTLSRPGGNITGLTNMDSELGAKRLEFLLAVVPGTKRVAFIVNAGNPNYVSQLREVEPASVKLGVRVVPFPVRTSADIEARIAGAKQEGVDGAMIVVDPYLNQLRRQIAALAIKHRLPIVGGVREFAQAGGLASYGEDLADFYRRAAPYVDKVLKGARPGDIAFDRSTKVELTLNQGTAKELGIVFPEAMLARADAVI